jgi:hypothetical protein
MSSPILFGRITSERFRFAWSGAAGILGCVLCGLRLRLSAALRGVRANFCRQQVLAALFTHHPVIGLAELVWTKGRHTRCCIHLHHLVCIIRWCSQVINPSPSSHEQRSCAATARERRSSSRSTTTTTTSELVTAEGDFCTRQPQHLIPSITLTITSTIV